ncbi:cell division protein ZipA C-terminal FtsZ-binding domain-containing protein [Vreelandella subglaciescola]|uniref:Cell division protein ZipA n=1 Tax=Vreelandella subglaciescola TaxID=29571 RepID=A0A1M7I539_9GAMM|nr:cell division protein ZipA C-terminal FtsZ-binding domain-containing protein [Halomonas subglaciescola]SHM35902.1 cell division protein ZipA [Halomonas subglaciescola]
MELREWLIILGLALVSLIVIDGVRRLQRQRRVPRLDQAAHAAGSSDPDEAAREAELDWELPNGGARVVKPADYSAMTEKPKLKRREPEQAASSRVLSEFRRSASSPAPQTAPDVTMPVSSPVPPSAPPSAETAAHDDVEEETPTPAFAIRADAEDARAHQVHYRAEAEPREAPRRQLSADIVGEYDEDEDEYRLVDFEGMGRSMKKRLAKRQKDKQHAKQLKQQEKARRAEAQAKEQAERQARKQQDQEDKQRRVEAQQAADAEQARLAAEPQRQVDAERAAADAAAAEASAAEDAFQPDDYQPEEWEDDALPAGDPVLEQALRNDVPGGPARDTLTDADEMIVISVLSRDEEGFDGVKLLQLLMACGLRYSRGLGVFHRFETESEDSALQFSMVNVVKPGSFPVEEGEPFTSPGITFLMPLPGGEDSAAAFEAMVETAMVVVRHMGGELKDENHSVMTAQTIEFARQRVHEFERRHRLHRQLQAQ